MRVIGISGMHGSIAHKRRAFRDLDRRLYRIVQGLDSAAALVTEDGVVAAAAEERFTGEKTTGDFPVNAIRYCLREARLSMQDIDCVAAGFDYRPSELHELTGYTRSRYRDVYAADVKRGQLQQHWPDVDWPDRFVCVPHHLAHAASSYYLSGFDESLVIVADGMGETESMTVFVGAGRELTSLHTVPALHSLGTLYGAVTLYLGFEFGMDEYKVMGLAPYGDRERYAAEAAQLVNLGPDGSYTVPVLAENRSWVERETLAGTVCALTSLFGPPREPAAPLEQRHRDIAAAVQSGLERTLLHVVRHFTAVTGQRSLCLAGGVALNCTANGLIAGSGLVDRIFVQPAAGDDGSALGAALHVQVTRGAGEPPGRMTMPYWGPGYGPAEVATAVESARRRADCAVQLYGEESALVDRVARLIAAGHVVGWFAGRMEFGPRALGNRSILADPGDPAMRDRLNAVVKQREEFRPFAPVVRAEDAALIFEISPGDEDRYAHMLFVTGVREPFRAMLPAVTHVDGSARVQVVRREHNPRLWRVLARFGELTGLPVLLNTSLNLRGQPIICDPDLALRTYLASELDDLVLGDHLVSRASRAVPAEPESPRGQLEGEIAMLWAQRLDRAGFGRDEDFFAVGGHSLAAVQVAGRMRERLGTDLPVDLVFSAPTVRLAARQVQRARAERRLAGMPGPRSRPSGAAIPLTFIQERICFFEQRHPGTATYHVPWAVEITGPLDAGVLQQALDTVMARHEALRTAFPAGAGLPVPTVRPGSGFPLRRHDLSERPETLDDALRAWAVRPFDLAAGPLIRADLARLSDTEHVLLVTAHHLVIDGWSVGVLLRELAASYGALAAGEAIDLPRLPLQYGDVATWVRAVGDGDTRSAALRYWAGELGPAAACTPRLPTGRPRPDVPGHAGGIVRFTVPEEVTAGVRVLARERGTTPFTVTLAAFQALFHRYTGEPDLVVATTAANRDRPELEDVVGPMFTSLPVRAEFAGDPTFAELVDQVDGRIRRGYRHQEVPFEALAAELVPDRDPGRSPLAEVLLEFDVPVTQPAPPGFAWSARLVDTGTAKVDLAVTLVDDGDRLAGAATYRTDVYDGAVIDRLAADLLRMLAAGCAEPDQPVSRLAADVPPAPPHAAPFPARDLNGARSAAGPVTVTGHAGGPANRRGSALTDLVSALCAELLFRPAAEVTADDDFFTLGGRSLDVLRLAVRIRDTFHVDVPVVQLFRQSTVAEIARAVVEHEPVAGRSERIAAEIRRRLTADLAAR